MKNEGSRVLSRRDLLRVAGALPVLLATGSNLASRRASEGHETTVAAANPTANTKKIASLQTDADIQPAISPEFDINKGSNEPLGRPDLNVQDVMVDGTELKEKLKTPFQIDTASFTRENGKTIAYVLGEGGRVFRSDNDKAFKEVGKAPVDVAREIGIRDSVIYITGRRLGPKKGNNTTSFPVACVSYDGGKSFLEMDLRLPPAYDPKLLPVKDSSRILVHAEENHVSGSTTDNKPPFNMAIIDGGTISPIDISRKTFSSVSGVGVTKLDPDTAVVIGIGESDAGVAYSEIDLKDHKVNTIMLQFGAGIDRLYPIFDEDGFPQEAFAFTANGQLVRIGLTINGNKEQIDLKGLLDTRLNQLFTDSKDNEAGCEKGSMVIMGKTLWFSGLRYNASEGIQPLMGSIPIEKSSFSNIRPEDITVVSLATTKISSQGEIKRRAYPYQGIETGISTARIGKDEGVVGVFETYLAFAGVDDNGKFNGKVKYPIKGLS